MKNTAAAVNRLAKAAGLPKGWKVRRFDPAAFDFSGLCEYHTRTVWIDETLTGITLWDTVIHEVAHALAPCETCDHHCAHWGLTYRRLSRALPYGGTR